MNNNYITKTFTENIPQELKGLKCWVGYRLVPRENGKYDKVPINPYTGGGAMPNNPTTWATFREAVEAVGKYKLSGIGFMFSKEDPYIGIDIDNCIGSNGDLSEQAKDIINLINSYTEKSVSGSGVHILCKGKIPCSRKDNKTGIEVYDSSRFFVVTGDILEDSITKIENRTEEVERFYNKYFPSKIKKEDINPKYQQIPIQQIQLASSIKNASNSKYEDALERAFKSRNGSKIQALFNGDLTEYNGDHSAADMAMANYLAFYTNKDSVEMDNLIRNSGLYRPKWDEVHYSNGQTYGQAIIQKAVNDCTATYDPLDYYRNNLQSNNHNTNVPIYYEVNPLTGRKKINSGLLARHLLNQYQAINVEDTFYLYKDGVYKPITKGERYAIIKQFVEDRYITTSILKDTEFQWVHDISIKKNIQQINSTPYIINLKNGLFDLINKQVLPHTPQYLNTIQINVAFDPNAKCPTFMKFLEESVDADTISLIQELLGYMLIPITVAQKSFIIVGPSNTGKSTFLKVIQNILGEENVSNIAWQNLSDRFKTAELHNKLANLCADLPSKPIEDTGIFKMLTGEDSILAERKYGDPFSFNNVARLLFSCNSLPPTFDKSDAFYNRLIIIPFNNKIVQINPFLSKELEQEKDGIFIWALEGLYRLIQNNFKFTENKAIEEILNNYKEEQSNIQYFIKEKCILGPDKYVQSQHFYNEYKKFCLENNLRALSIQKFTSELISNNPTITKKQVGTSRTRCFSGVELLTDICS